MPIVETSQNDTIHQFLQRCHESHGLSQNAGMCVIRKFCFENGVQEPLLFVPDNILTQNHSNNLAHSKYAFFLTRMYTRVRSTNSPESPHNTPVHLKMKLIDTLFLPQCHVFTDIPESAMTHFIPAWSGKPLYVNHDYNEEPVGQHLLGFLSPCGGYPQTDDPDSTHNGVPVNFYAFYSLAAIRRDKIPAVLNCLKETSLAKLDVSIGYVSKTHIDDADVVFDADGDADLLGTNVCEISHMPLEGSLVGPGLGACPGATVVQVYGQDRYVIDPSDRLQKRLEHDVRVYLGTEWKKEFISPYIRQLCVNLHNKGKLTPSIRQWLDTMGTKLFLVNSTTRKNTIRFFDTGKNLKTMSTETIASPISDMAQENPVMQQPPMAQENPVMQQPPMAQENPMMQQPPMAQENPMMQQPPMAQENPVMQQPPMAQSTLQQQPRQCDVVNQQQLEGQTNAPQFEAPYTVQKNPEILNKEGIIEKYGKVHVPEIENARKEKYTIQDKYCRARYAQLMEHHSLGVVSDDELLDRRLGIIESDKHITAQKIWEDGHSQKIIEAVAVRAAAHGLKLEENQYKPLRELITHDPAAGRAVEMALAIPKTASNQTTQLQCQPQVQQQQMSRQPQVQQQQMSRQPQVQQQQMSRQPQVQQQQQMSRQPQVQQQQQQMSYQPQVQQQQQMSYQPQVQQQQQQPRLSTVPDIRPNTTISQLNSEVMRATDLLRPAAVTVPTKRFNKEDGVYRFVMPNEPARSATHSCDKLFSSAKAMMTRIVPSVDDATATLSIKECIEKYGRPSLPKSAAIQGIKKFGKSSDSARVISDRWVGINLKNAARMYSKLGVGSIFAYPEYSQHVDPREKFELTVHASDEAFTFNS
jgi:hypothetical protein